MFKVLCPAAYIGVCLFLFAALPSEALARSYSLQQLNAMRYDANLPPLTGNRRIDLPQLARECNAGIEFACTLLPQQQQPRYQPQYQRDQIIPLPRLDERNAPPAYIRPSEEIIALPPIDSSPEEWAKFERDTQRQKNLQDSEERRQDLQRERQSQQDEIEHQNQMNRIDRMFR